MNPIHLTSDQLRDIVRSVKETAFLHFNPTEFPITKEFYGPVNIRGTVSPNGTIELTPRETIVEP